MTNRTLLTEANAPTIVFDNVQLTLGGTTILKQINLRLDAGKTHALIGPNGGGKSSLIRALLGQVPHTGHIHFQWPQQEGRLGYVPQALEFDRSLPMTVMDFMVSLQSTKPAFFRQKHAFYQTILNALERVGMSDKAQRRMGALSGGERQRVMMAQGLMPEPSVLILDEPMAALDDTGAQVFEALLQSLKDKGTTLLWIEHDLSAIKRLADTVTGLRQTIRLHGAPDKALSTDALLSLFSHTPQPPHSITLEAAHG